MALPCTSPRPTLTCPRSVARPMQRERRSIASMVVPSGRSGELPAGCAAAPRGLPTCGHDIGAAGSPPRRGCQVAVVSPFPFQATFDCALSSAVRGTPHPADTGLLLGRRPFHHLPTDPPVRHLPRAVGLCRFCSVARTLARRAPARPRVPRRGDFPQRPVDSDADHRQLPSASWRCAIPLGGEKPSAGSRRQTR